MADRQIFSTLFKVKTNNKNGIQTGLNYHLNAVCVSFKNSRFVLKQPLKSGTLRFGNAIGWICGLYINNHTHIARESEKIRALKAEWDQWKMEMLNDEDWCATLVRYSGKGILILNNAYQIMKCFDDYVILRSSENTIQTKKDYQSGLFGWWRYNNWETDLQILTGAKAAMIENKCSAPRTTQKTSKIEEAMAVAERASEMAYQLMQQNPL